MAEETKPKDEPVDKTDGEEPVAEPTEKSNEIMEAVKALGDMVTSLTAEMDTIKAKVFPSEEEEDEPDEDKADDEEDEEDKEKSLTLVDIKKAIREELKGLVKDTATATPRPQLTKHELDDKQLTKALSDRTALARMSIKEIDALVDAKEMPEVKPW